jgi:hypothetical protein
MEAVFIVLENPTATGSIRLGRTEDRTDTIWEVYFMKKMERRINKLERRFNSHLVIHNNIF